MKFFSIKKQNVVVCLSVLTLVLDAHSATATEETVPLEKNSWVVLSYNKISPNKVSFSDSKIIINVNQSAGPIVYKLPAPRKISSFHIKGRVKGMKKIETSSFDEDSILRFGLVATGKHTLSGPKSWFAADWVKRFFALAPKESGLDKIYFYNVTNRSELIGRSRAHPRSDLMHEEVILKVSDETEFQLNKVFTDPKEVAALWLSVDGDNSSSEFETIISEIKIKFLP